MAVIIELSFVMAAKVKVKILAEFTVFRQGTDAFEE